MAQEAFVGDGNNTLNKDSGVHTTPKEDKLSFHGTGAKGSCRRLLAETIMGVW